MHLCAKVVIVTSWIKYMILIIFNLGQKCYFMILSYRGHGLNKLNYSSCKLFSL